MLIKNRLKLFVIKKVFLKYFKAFILIMSSFSKITLIIKRINSIFILAFASL